MSQSHPKYTLRVRDRFEAAHALRLYRGEPEPLHGHSWEVEVALGADELDQEGMAVDFVRVKRELSRIIEPFHHRNLNETPPFDRVSPTTESIARHVYEALSLALSDVDVLETTIWEGRDCSATYRPIANS